MYRWLWIALMVLAMACQSETTTPSSTENPSPIRTPTLTNQQRIEYESQYEALRHSQAAIETIWRDVQSNRAVSCADEIPQQVLPADVIGEDNIGQLLFKAATEVNDAIVLWRAECQNPRTNPPISVINQGLTTALTAAETLANVEQYLKR